MSKKVCDAETQNSRGMGYSWSYPKILQQPVAEELQNNGYVSVQKKWCNTITLKSLARKVKKLKKLVNRNAPEKKIKSTGVQRILEASSREVIRQRFPETTISRTRGHSFDDGVIIWSKKPECREPVVKRLRYKPCLQVSSQPTLPTAVFPVLSTAYEELQQKILKTQNLLCHLENEKKLQKMEVRNLNHLLKDDFSIKIFKKLIENLQKSPEHQAAAKRRVVEYHDLLEEYVPLPGIQRPLEVFVPPLNKKEIMEMKKALPSPVKRPRVELHPDFVPSIFQRLGEKVATSGKNTRKRGDALPRKNTRDAAATPAPILELPSAVRRLRESFAAYEPAPLVAKKSTVPRRPLSAVVKSLREQKPAQTSEELTFKIPEVPPKKSRKIRPVFSFEPLPTKDDLEFAQMCSNIEVAAERVTKRSKKVEEMISRIFDCPALPQKEVTPTNDQERSIEKELDDFMDFEIIDE